MICCVCFSKFWTCFSSVVYQTAAPRIQPTLADSATKVRKLLLPCEAKQCKRCSASLMGSVVNTRMGKKWLQSTKSDSVFQEGFFSLEDISNLAFRCCISKPKSVQKGGSGGAAANLLLCLNQKLITGGANQDARSLFLAPFLPDYSATATSLCMG